jgi:hypothetical protein
MFPIDYTITFSIGAIVGFCVRMVIEDKIIRKRDKDKRYADAFNTFAQSFNSAIHMIDQKKEISYVIAYLELSKHRDAMLNFIHFLEGKSKDRFNDKWTQYENKCEEIEEHGKTVKIADGLPGLFEFAHDPVEVQQDQTYKEELKCLIQELLKTAQR